MKLGSLKLSGVSVVLLVVQLALISSIGAKYLYQRAKCPRVWTRVIAVDPEAPIRGRYLSLRLTVNGCESTFPSAKQAVFQRNIDGTTKPLPYFIAAQIAVQFPARLTVKNGKLTAIRIQPTDGPPTDGELISAMPEESCEAMRLANPANFYIAEHATSPLPLKAGSELWMEVTVTPKGPPRPIQLALKQDNAWKPLAFQ